MPTTIKLKNSVTTTSVPSSLVQGEVAINITDKKVWVGNAATTPIQLLGGGADGNFTNISVSSVATFGAGTVSAPSITTSGDTNTGIYFPAADTIAFTEGGAEAMRIDSSGRVLIGSTSASGSNLLQVTGDASISGLTVGKGGGAISTNTAIGTSALNANTTGSANTAIGNQSMLLNTTGAGSTAVGFASLRSNTTGINDAHGYQALYFNTTGTNNAALGYAAMQSNTTGGYNTGLGYFALYSNTTASNNTAVGYQAGYSNTTGTGLTLVGGLGSNSRAAGYSLTSGSYSVAVGAGALGATTTASHNTAVGYDAMNNNTTGADNIALGNRALINNTTGSYNTGLGRDALLSNTTANDNTAVGYLAGYSNTTGTSNLFLGRRAGYSNTTSGNNTYVGEASGNSTTGNANTFVGNAAGNAVTTGSKNTILGVYNGNQGGLDIRTASNWIVLSDGDGNPRMSFNSTGKPVIYNMDAGAGTNALRYSTSTGAITYDTSSARYKDNIRDSKYGLADVMQMRSAQFEYKDDGRSDVGLIAEELQPIIPELVGTDKEGRADSVSYDRIVSVLVKAIQELKAEVDSLKAQLNK